MKDRSTFWKKILIDSVGLKKGSCVIVDGYREQLDELELLASECYINGIYPILKLSLSSQSLEYIAENEAPENIEAKHLLALIEGIEAWICIFGWWSGKGKRREYPPEYQPSGRVFEKMGRKRVKFVLVMLPPPEGHPLRDAVRKAFECDYNQISSLGKKLKDALKDSENVHLKTKDGTDLHFSLKNRPILVEDGILDEEDLKEDFTLALPSGVVSLFPIETTVNGTVFVKKAREYRYGTGDLEDVTLQFEQGHLVDWKAKKGSNSIKKFLEKTKGTSDMFCEVCLGINDKVVSYVGLPNIDELRYGAADIAIGHNRPFGKSSTNPPIHWHFSVGKINLAVEGKTLIKNGEIV
ncbi:MAG: aminopeptidase [Candidatus Bathyarchaeota archaeon]